MICQVLKRREYLKGRDKKQQFQLSLSIPHTSYLIPCTLGCCSHFWLCCCVCVALLLQLVVACLASDRLERKKMLIPFSHWVKNEKETCLVCIISSRKNLTNNKTTLCLCVGGNGPEPGALYKKDSLLFKKKKKWY